MKELWLNLLTTACRLSPESQQIHVAHVEGLKRIGGWDGQRHPKGEKLPRKETKSTNEKRAMPEQSQNEESE